MCLISTYQSSAIRLNLSAKNEYVQLKGESKMTSLPKLVLTNVSLTLTLLNVRSLKKHVMVYFRRYGLLQNDALALTEIQLKQEENLSPIVTQISCHFSRQFNLNENNYRSSQYAAHIMCL